MHPSVTYTTCATPSMEQTCNIITFTQFEEGNLLSKTRNDEESGDEFDEDSIMPPLLSLEEIDTMDSGNESYYDTISTEMLDGIRERSQFHPNVNRREARYKIRDFIKQRK